MNRRRLILWGAGLAALGGIVAAALAMRRDGAPDDDLATLGRGVDAVQLTSAQGEQVRWGDLKGRPRAVFFGFTHCPVICPVTVYELNDALDRIGVPASGVAIDFVTLDPERDTPDRLRSYFSEFGPRIASYTGDAAQIERLTQSFEIIANRTELEGGDYTIDHTTTVFLMDASGRVVDVIAYGSPPDLIEARLRDLAGRS